MKLTSLLKNLLKVLVLGLVMTACFSKTEGQAPFSVSSEEKPTKLVFTTDPGVVKETLDWCRRQGGKFHDYPGLTATDLVDCRLPPSRGEAKILVSAYDYLTRIAVEKPGYGLYSYVLLPARSSRGERFLQHLFATTSFVELIGIDPHHVNLIYLPTQAEQLKRLIPLVKRGTAPPIDVFAEQFYDYALAQRLLAQICLHPVESIEDVCASDLSRGPYLFTYTQPASTLSPAPPPYLFVDLSQVHENAFGELVGAYKEQVKRGDYTDLERIDNFKQRLLNVTLKAADTLGSITDAIKQAVHLIKDNSSE